MAAGGSAKNVSNWRVGLKYQNLISLMEIKDKKI
jgi:hypothetical protein